MFQSYYRTRRLGVVRCSDFLAKIAAETALCAIEFSGLGDWPGWATSALADYRAHPDTFMGPGPSDLSKLVFGPAWDLSQFEAVRRRVNRLLATATISYKDSTMRPGHLTGPVQQSAWCKLKGVLHDYVSQTLGLAES